MKSKKTGKDLEEHIDKAVSKIDKYLHGLANVHPKKAELISYWIHDFTKMVDLEDSFIRAKKRRYKKGDIVKVNLGFNIGSEQGGLHYAVVLEKHNPYSHATITIAPLTSVDIQSDTKKGTRYGEIHLGTELYDKLIDKCDSEIENCSKCIKALDFENIPNCDISEYKETLEKFNRHQKEAKKTLKEIEKMKSGSICLINQITTISKIRIYNPKSNKDVLHGIRLSDETLDIIDENIRKFFLK